MTTMRDGSPRLPNGTYVRVTPQRVQGLDGAVRQDPSYIGKVVGTDMGNSKYQIGARCGGWGRWIFLDGGSWAFIGEVTEITAEEALAIPFDEA